MNKKNITIFAENFKEVQAKNKTNKLTTLDALYDILTMINEPIEVDGYQRTRNDKEHILIRALNPENKKDGFTKIYTSAILDMENESWKVQVIAKYTCSCPCSDLVIANILFPTTRKEFAKARKNYQGGTNE